MEENVFFSNLDASQTISMEGLSVTEAFRECFSRNWENNALTDYQGATIRYCEFAEKIARIHILYKSIGLQPGDKVAICAKNCSNWAVAFFAAFTFGAVPVPILADFKADYIHNIVNHSEAKVLYAGDNQWNSIDTTKMPAVLAYFFVKDLTPANSDNAVLSETFEQLDEIFSKRHPHGFTDRDMEFHKESDPDAMAILNYTSGTTSFPKGVMIPYRALRHLLSYSARKMPLKPGSSTVCMLPLAHMFGMMFELIYDIALGCHIHFLTRIPSPKIIFQTFAEFKPTLIITVPLVIEKVVQNKILPIMNKPSMKIALHIPVLRRSILNKMRQKLIDAFGGEMMELIIGGAALNKEVEDCLRMMRFPYSVGYGATECAPLIAYTHWFNYKKGTCGCPIEGVEIEIHSNDPENEPGEITVRGDNVMLGYYKNPEATAQAIDSEGWFYTGDMGLMDKDGNITIKGRSKNMILGPSGQNIYPEEIEEVINALPNVEESLVVERDDRLVALVVVNQDAFKGEDLSRQQIEERLDADRKAINVDLPSYERINSFVIMDEGFEKTPKGSIKRFLYQDKK